MPQNWWDIYPEVLSSPAAGSYPLPGPEGIMPGPAIGLGRDPLSGAPMLGQPPVGPFDPSYFSGGAPGMGQIPGGSPDQAPPIGYPQPPLPGDQAGPVLGRDAVIQHAATAIQRGADPSAVRARLTQMGLTDLDPPSPFVDLIPDARQSDLAMNDADIPLPMSALPPQQDLSGMEGWHPAAYAQDSLRDVQRRADPSFAPQKGGDASKYYQAMANDPDGDRSDTLGRAIVDDVRRLSQPNPPPPPRLTPWQQRRRQQNEMLATNPRVRAFLDMISHSEGDTNYRSLFGNHHQTFTDQSTHPGNRGEIYHGTHGGAAGRYQIMPRTYSSLNRLLGPYTMSDRDQDLMAVELIREADALGPLVSGQQPDLATAISRLGRRKTWTSFPVLENGSWQPNPSHQPTRNFEDLQRSFSGALDQARRRLGYR